MPNRKYESLLVQLENRWDSDFSDLPQSLKNRVKEAFFPIGWDRTNADGRMSLAAQHDYQNDPQQTEQWDYWFDFFIEKQLIKDKIREWRALIARTITEKDLQETRLKELSSHLAAMEEEENTALSDKTTSDDAPKVGSKEWRIQNARKAANAKLDQPGGYREAHEKIRKIWASGKYATLNECARMEHENVRLSYSAARRALSRKDSIS